MNHYSRHTGTHISHSRTNIPVYEVEDDDDIIGSHHHKKDYEELQYLRRRDNDDRVVVDADEEAEFANFLQMSSGIRNNTDSEKSQFKRLKVKHDDTKISAPVVPNVAKKDFFSDILHNETRQRIIQPNVKAKTESVGAIINDYKQLLLKHSLQAKAVNMGASLDTSYVSMSHLFIGFVCQINIRKLVQSLRQDSSSRSNRSNHSSSSLEPTTTSAIQQNKSDNKEDAVNINACIYDALKPISLRFLHEAEYVDSYAPYVLGELMASMVTQLEYWLLNRSIKEEFVSNRMDRQQMKAFFSITSTVQHSMLRNTTVAAVGSNVIAPLKVSPASLIEFQIVAKVDQQLNRYEFLHSINKDDLIIITKRKIDSVLMLVELLQSEDYFIAVVQSVKQPTHSGLKRDIDKSFHYTILASDTVSLHVEDVCTIIPFISMTTAVREWVAVLCMQYCPCSIPLAPYLLRGSAVCSLELLNSIKNEMTECVQSIIQHNDNRRRVIQRGKLTSEDRSNDVKTRERIVTTQNSIVEYLRVLDHVVINGSVLRNSGLGKCLSVIANASKSKNTLYCYKATNDALLDEFYMDVALSNEMMELSKKLIDTWTIQIKKDHKKSTINNLSGGNVVVPSEEDSLLIPPDNISSHLWSELSRKYNPSQLLAISYSVNRMQEKVTGTVNASNNKDGISITLIQGPPGTGKTSTIMGLVASLLCVRTSAGEGGGKKSPLLVCAPSNAAIDEVLVRMNEGILNSNGITDKIRLVRLGATTAAAGSEQKAKIDKLSLDAIVDDIVQHHATYIALQATIREMQQLLQALDKVKSNASDAVNGVSPTELKTRYKYLKCLRGTQETDVEILRLRIRTQVLLDADVILSTLSSAGGSVLLEHVTGKVSDGEKQLINPLKESAEGMQNIMFDTVIIDEAVQCTEAATLIPLHYGCKHLILIGDPRQLPATILCNHPNAKQYYGTSLFERLERSGHEVIMLNTQYRMHADIRQFPSDQFYFGKLVDGIVTTSNSNGNAPSWLTETGDMTPFCFLNTSMIQTQSSSIVSYTTSCEEQASGTSYINPGEIRLIVSMLQQWSSRLPTMPSDYTIGILSPYKAQVKAIQRALLNMNTAGGTVISDALLRQVEVNTIDGFQGREKDIVIISAVRSRSSNYSRGGIGFVVDARRLNVAITRAKKNCVIIGNICTLSGVLKAGREEDNIWKALVLYMLQNHQVQQLNAAGGWTSLPLQDELAITNSLSESKTKS